MRARKRIEQPGAAQHAKQRDDQRHAGSSWLPSTISNSARLRGILQRAKAYAASVPKSIATPVAPTLTTRLLRSARTKVDWPLASPKAAGLKIST